MSMVPKFKLVRMPMSRPKKTNISIREMPVMISGFTMGRLVTVFMAAFMYLLRSLFMPTAAAVPMMVESSAAHRARIRVAQGPQGVFVVEELLVPVQGEAVQHGQAVAAVEGEHQHDEDGGEQKEEKQGGIDFGDGFHGVTAPLPRGGRPAFA